jgi:hypothetical protein
MKIHAHISRDLERLLEFPAFDKDAVVVPVQGEKYTPGKTFLWLERVVGELKVVVTIEPGRTENGEKVIHVNAYTLFAEGCPYCGHPLKAGEPCGNCGAW